MIDHNLPWAYSHLKSGMGYRRWETLKLWLRPSARESLMPSLQSERKILFIHIPKTAGVSLIKTYDDYIPGARHSPALQYKAILGSEFFEWSRFAIVRNPWARLFSAYNFLVQGGLIESDRRMGVVLRDACPSFEHFVKDWLPKKGVCSYMHFVPQHEFLCGWGSKLLVDNILKLERLSAEWPEFAQRVGLPVRDIPKMNAGSKAGAEKRYRDHYDAEAVDIVYELYRTDVNLLGYTYE